MVSSGLLRRVALVRTDVSEEPGASETSVHTRATRRNNPEGTILQLTKALMKKLRIYQFQERRNIKQCSLLFIRCYHLHYQKLAVKHNKT
jgi:hypothetical protein